VAVLLSLIAALFISFPQELSEYRLYFTETRPRTVLSFEEMSQDWSEEDLRARLKHVVFRCHDNRPGEYLDERMCDVDVSSHNGIPALTLTFYFTKNKLNHMAVRVPWWRQLSLSRLMKAAYGEPTGSQSLPIAGVRLSGWQLRSGNAVFMNRDLPINPLSWSMVFWSSERACQPKGCFSQGEQ
jgi:hypothetical protein